MCKLSDDIIGHIFVYLEEPLIKNICKENPHIGNYFKNTYTTFVRNKCIIQKIVPGDNLLESWENNRYNRSDSIYLINNNVFIDNEVSSFVIINNLVIYAKNKNILIYDANGRYNKFIVSHTNKILSMTKYSNTIYILDNLMDVYTVQLKTQKFIKVGKHNNTYPDDRTFMLESSIFPRKLHFNHDIKLINDKNTIKHTKNFCLINNNN